MAYRNPEDLRAWREENREHLLEQKRQWYLANRERCLERDRLRVRAPRVHDPAKYKEYYEKNRERMIAKSRRWLEANRERKRIQDKQRHLRNREDPVFRRSAVERARVWVMENRERYRASQNKARVRRKSRMAEASIDDFSQAQLDRRMAQFGGLCVYCSGPFQHIDHIVPVVAGGKHALWNLAPACRPCNTSKKDSDPLNWTSRRAINKTAIVVVEKAVRRHMRKANA